MIKSFKRGGNVIQTCRGSGQPGACSTASQIAAPDEARAVERVALKLERRLTSLHSDLRGGLVAFSLLGRLYLKYHLDFG